MESLHRIFLLSPAHCGGKRAGLLLNDAARFDLAQRIRQPGGVELGEVFAFLSGLYFRGKVAYARRFANPPAEACGAYAITTNRGLVPIETRIGIEDLRAMGCGQINALDLSYREPLERDLRRLAEQAPATDFVLLGSVASGKYVDILLEILGARLMFPVDFVGRGDMSRGGLMLRSAQAGQQLPYIPVSGAVRRGARPPKLEARRRK